MVTDRRNRKIANQGKEEVVVTVTVADSFSDLDLVVEACEFHPDEQRREHLCQIATVYEINHIQSVLRANALLQACCKMRSCPSLPPQQGHRTDCVDLTLCRNNTLLSLLGLIPICVPLNP